MLIGTSCAKYSMNVKFKYQIKLIMTLEVKKYKIFHKQLVLFCPFIKIINRKSLKI